MGFRVVKTPLDLAPSPSLLLRHPDCPDLAQENQAAPPAGTGATSGADRLTWHVWCQEQKLPVRENAVMRYFFSLCPFRQLGYFKPKLPGLQDSTRVPLPLPSRPLPTPEPARPLPACPRPVLGTALRREASGQLSRGRGPSTVGCRHALRHLFLLWFCFQPTLEQREKPGSTHKQIQSKETEI